RPKAVSLGPGSTVAASVAGTAADATAGSGSLRSDVATAATEAIACASSAPTGPVSALDVAPRVAPRFQIRVAVFSIPDHSKPPSLAAHHPAIVTVAHNSTSANCRGLAIARLPPRSATARHAAQPAHDWIDCPPTIASCKARKLAGNHFPKRCCPNATRVPKRCKTIKLEIMS